jgi:tetratricopeptide (TPR) repeat protein
MNIARTLAMLIIIALLNAPASPASPAAGSALEAALLAAKWRAVLEVIEDDVPVDAIRRVIRGHANLATNLNNDALLIFLSLTEADRTSWHAWASVFADEHAGSAVAQYLAGDAAARLGDGEAALAAYERCLEIDADFALGLVGRGVALTMQGDWNAARASFTLACEAPTPLAEAYASLGVLQTLRHAPDGARRSFEAALRISPDYALAMNGLGCAEYGTGEWERAQEHFLGAAGVVPLRIFTDNVRALAAASEAVAKTDEGTEPGTQLTWGGFTDQQQYKNSLTPSQLVEGQWRIDHVWGNIADVLQHSELPVATFVGKKWNDHLAKSTETNLRALSDKYGIRDVDLRPGGVTTKLRRGFVDRGSWPVSTWFGLAHGVQVADAEAETHRDSRGDGR